MSKIPIIANCHNYDHGKLQYPFYVNPLGDPSLYEDKCSVFQHYCRSTPDIARELESGPSAKL